jgi:hypothetical protein
MKFRYSILTLIIFFAFSSQVVATEYPPQDHAGGNLILANGDVICGVHTNINRFEIPTSATTVLIKPYDGVTTDTRGMVEIHANIIEIHGAAPYCGGAIDGSNGLLPNGGFGGSGGSLKIFFDPPSNPFINAGISGGRVTEFPTSVDRWMEL